MDRDTFLLSDKIKQIDSFFIKDGWATIYESNHPDISDQTLIYCCLVDSKRIKSYKLDSDWVVHNGSEGKSSIFSSYKNGKERVEYKTTLEKGVEPFIFARYFTLIDGSDSYIDVSEEFVLYFKLYEKIVDKKNRKYYFIDEIGDLDEVIIIEPKKVTIKLKYLKEYLSIRKMYFSVCFDFMRLCENSLSELNIEPIDKNYQGESFYYNHFIRHIDLTNGEKTQSWIHGKVIISPDKSRTKGYHFDYQNNLYEKFITGYDNNGNEILQDCRKENSKYFVVTYFKKEVLNKYYNEPSKYEVDGWSVKSNFFSLKIDNNIEEYVAVFLIELGMLPHKEQLHWKQFNIAPQKGISHSYYKTMIEGSWVEHPETPDLYFKHKYEQFNKKWESKFGWKFYKPLAKEDKYIYTSLHLPTSNNVKEFSEQILSLVKITIDRLNEQELKKSITLEKNDKGITKLEKFLKAKGNEIPEMILFLRNLWNLRSGLLSHSFSSTNKECMQAIEYFGIRDDNYVEVAKNIFIKSIFTLNTLEKKFLPKESSD